MSDEKKELSFLQKMKGGMTIDLAKPMIKAQMKSAGAKSYVISIDANDEVNFTPYDVDCVEFMTKANQRLSDCLAEIQRLNNEIINYKNKYGNE